MAEAKIGAESAQSNSKSEVEAALVKMGRSYFDRYEAGEQSRLDLSIRLQRVADYLRRLNEGAA